MKTVGTAKVNPETGEIESKIITPFIRSMYNYDRDNVSHETGTACEDATLAKQEFKEECDINTILERFNVTQELPQNVRQPLNVDFVEVTDFKTAMNAVIEAEQAFLQMPAKVRARFSNDPAEFIEFFEREENRAEAQRLGLIQAPPEAPKTPDAPPKGES